MRSIADREISALEAWLGGIRPGFASRYVVFDDEARESSRYEVATLSSSGATMIRPALALAAKIIDTDYPPPEREVLAVLMSDGDNWSREDTAESLELLRDRLLPRLVAFGCVQFESLAPAGVGFMYDVDSAFPGDPRVITALLEKPGDFVQPFTAGVALSPPRP